MTNFKLEIASHKYTICAKFHPNLFFGLCFVYGKVEES